MNYIIADDSVWGNMSVLLHVWFKSGCLNGIMTGDVCGEVFVLLHVWIMVEWSITDGSVCGVVSCMN